LKSHRRVILESTFKPADTSQTSPFRVRNYFSPPIVSIIAELTLYFSGSLKEFSTPLCLATGTDFQRKVWSALRQVGYGQSVSYAQLSSDAHVSGAHRAAANAVGANRFVIVVPCHRVIRENGGLGGFSCGIERKIWLRQHEEKIASSSSPPPSSPS
jgi:O-6-methylguanine DNA methyltransferase